MTRPEFRDDAWRATLWDEIADEVPEPVRSVLAAVARSIGDRTVYRATYRYGDDIIRDGELRMPGASALSVPSDLKYQAIPLGFSLDEPVEVFQERVPKALRVLRRGEFFGVFEFLDKLQAGPAPIPSWNASAGIRSVCILVPLGRKELPKAAHGIYRKRIPPETFRGETFKLVRAMSEAGAYDWRARVVLLPGAWLAEPARAPLEQHLYEIGWRQAQHFRHLSQDGDEVRRLIATDRRRIEGHDRHSTAYVDVWRFVIAAARGDVPVYVPAVGSVGGPWERACRDVTSLLEKCRCEWTPVVLHADHLSRERKVGYHPLAPFRRTSDVDERDGDIRARGMYPEFVEPLQFMKEKWARENQRCISGLDLEQTAFLALGKNNRRGSRSESAAVVRELWGNESSLAYTSHEFLTAFLRVVRL